MSAKVLITVTPTGDSTVKVEGVAGDGCKALSENIEKALGVVACDIPTAEMREVNTNANAENRY